MATDSSESRVDFACRFIDGQVGLVELETWPYATESLEDLWGCDGYLELIALDYRRSHAAQQSAERLASKSPPE